MPGMERAFGRQRVDGRLAPVALAVVVSGAEDFLSRSIVMRLLASRLSYSMGLILEAKGVPSPAPFGLGSYFLLMLSGIDPNPFFLHAEISLEVSWEICLLRRDDPSSYDDDKY